MKSLHQFSLSFHLKSLKERERGLALWDELSSEWFWIYFSLTAFWKFQHFENDFAVNTTFNILKWVYIVACIMFYVFIFILQKGKHLGVICYDQTYFKQNSRSHCGKYHSFTWSIGLKFCGKAQFSQSFGWLDRFPNQEIRWKYGFLRSESHKQVHKPHIVTFNEKSLPNLTTANCTNNCQYFG